MNVVFLTGMHRSGTSLVSRVVNLQGADLGPATDLMPAKPDNPTGFWENRDVIALDDDLLAALGGRWDDPPVLEDGWEGRADLDELRARAEGVMAGLVEREDAGRVLVMKDPRSSLLLPFWRAIAPIGGTILTIRHPGDVAASLAARDGMDGEQAAHLWLRYVVAAWRGDPKRLVVRYSDLFEDLDGQLARLGEHLGLPTPSAEARAQIGEFVDPGLRHHAGGAGDGGPTMALATALFELFPLGSEGLLDPIAEALHELWIERKHKGELAGRVAAREHELAVAIGHRDELLVERDIAVERGEELDRTVAELQEHAAAAQDAARIREEQLTAELAAARERIERLEIRIRVQGETIDATEAAGQRLRREVARQEAEIADLDQQRAELESSLRRWRIHRLEALLRRWRLLR